MRINVRHLAPEDVDKVTKLIARLKDLNSELDPHYMTIDNLEDVVRDYVKKSAEDPNVVFLLAEDEETKRIVGILRAQFRDRAFYKPRNALVITDIYVDPRYRRKGLGSLLLRKLEETAREKGIEMLIAVYPAGNVIADDFFNKKGFKLLQVERYKHIE
jgi:GNAT superfamily N-acetyltransferase